MADDDWENEDFSVKIPTLSQTLKDWDEEDVVDEDALKVATPSAAQVEAAEKKKKEEELKLANALKFASLENETADERKARERKQIEAADNELTGELFGGKADGTSSSGKGSSSSLASMVAGTSLKSKDDHKNFGIICAKKMADSTAFNVAAFYKSLTEKLEGKMTYETVDEVLTIFNKIKEEKKKTAEPAKAGAQKKSKSQVKAETKKHSDVFGGSEYADKYDDYAASKCISRETVRVPNPHLLISSLLLCLYLGSAHRVTVEDDYM